MNFRSKIKSPKFRVINQKVIQSLPRNIPSFIYLRNNRFDGRVQRHFRLPTALNSKKFILIASYFLVFRTFILSDIDIYIINKIEANDLILV